MTENFKNYINGKWVDSGTPDKTIVNINPANKDEVNGYFQSGTREDAKDALKAAEDAYQGWRRVPPAKRARIVNKVWQLAEERKPGLAEIMTREEGKIIGEATGEITKGNTLLEWFAGEGMRLMGVSAYSELPDNYLYTIRKPLGVVSIITPWNFPWAIPCWKIAPALIAGNTVVFKPASSTPWLAVKLTQLFEEAGIPPGVLNLIIGPGSSVGDEIVNNSVIKAVSFTGSNEIGAGVNRIASEKLIKATLEMGGKNPCVVMEDGDLDLALPGIIKGAFGNAGQRCTATSRIVVMESVADELVKRLVEKIGEMKIGPGLDKSSSMGPVVDEHQYNSVKKYLEIGKKESDLKIGGDALTEGDRAKGFFIAPTVFDNVTPDMTIAREEIFGPVLAIERVKTYEEAISVANDVDYGLSSAIFTRDIGRAMRFIDDIEAGMIHINSPTIGGEAQVPFGGIKATGVGEREMAKEGINFFTEQCTVFIDYTGGARDSNIY